MISITGSGGRGWGCEIRTREGLHRIGLLASRGRSPHRAQAEQQARVDQVGSGRLVGTGEVPGQADGLRAAAPHVLPYLQARRAGGVALQLAPPGWASTNW